MLKHNEVNPLTVFGLRRINHCPPHFISVAFDIHTNDKQITDWIWEHLSGRFYYGDLYTENQNSSISMYKQAAFEIPGEASYFSLVLDTIQKNNSFA
jgi:hypothetical protein